MALYFKRVLQQIDGDLNDKVLQASETIHKYKRTHNFFMLENFQVYLAYRVTQDLKNALKILNSTEGNNQFNEYNRLLLLNQFETVYKQLSQSSLEVASIDQKLIAAFYLLGQNEYSIAQFYESYSDELELLRQLIQVNKNQLTGDNQLIQVECAFREQQLLLNWNFKIRYVEKFRLQAYHFEVSKNVNINNILIEMTFAQMCRIMILPTDYYNEYYNAFEYTIMTIFNRQKVISNYQQFLISIQFSNPIIRIHDEGLFMNAVHTGITRAIINNKIQLQNIQNSEMKTGILDACLILRRLLKWSQHDPIDDLIYETLIYKLQ